jgi:hypothetical protein
VGIAVAELLTLEIMIAAKPDTHSHGGPAYLYKLRGLFEVCTLDEGTDNLDIVKGHGRPNPRRLNAATDLVIAIDDVHQAQSWVVIVFESSSAVDLLVIEAHSAVVENFVVQFTNLQRAAARKPVVISSLKSLISWSTLSCRYF